MARRPTEQRLYDELLDRFGREIAEAFMAAVADLRTAADLQRVITAIEAGNVEAAVAALNLDRAAMNPVLDALRDAHTSSGQTAVSYLPLLRDASGAVLVVRFDARNPRAEAWLAEHSSGLVTRIVDDQRAAVRQALTGGMARGDNPRTTALDVVGRIDRTSGRRDGGILGLTAQQESFVASARQELASADPAVLAHYLTRKRRDKRFDRSVAKAIGEGRALPAATAGRALRQYKNRLLKLRGDTIGRTESLTALRAAKHEAYKQAVDKGAVAESAVRRTWRTAGDQLVRHTHAELNGDTVGLHQPFRSPTGALLMFPGDTSLGAGAEEVIGCRCDVGYRIDFLANL